MTFAILCGIFGFVVGAIFMVVFINYMERRPDGLPCPHPMCRNRLPRQAALTTGGWAEEDCPICLGRVRFVSYWSPYGDNGGKRHTEDRWLRVHVPEAKS